MVKGVKVVALGQLKATVDTGAATADATVEVNELVKVVTIPLVETFEGWISKPLVDDATEL